jgi:hypothetical protein
MSLVAHAVEDVRTALRGGRVTTATRTKFQAIALVLREERARVKADESIGDARRTEKLKRLDDTATNLAKTAVRHPALLALLSEDAVVTDDAKSMKRDMLRKAGIESEPEEAPQPVEEPSAAPAKQGVVPQSVV